MSSIIREPLNGEPAICPVPQNVRLWLSSPSTAVENLWHAHVVSAGRLGQHRTINLPGLSITVGEMIEALERVAGSEVAARIRFERDPTVERIVASWPGRSDTSVATSLGFKGDSDFGAVVREYQAAL